MGVAVNGAAALRPLLAFNLGVESGQIGIAAIALPAILSLGLVPRLACYLRPATSVGVIAMGTWWLLERVAWI
jgi:hypothetical protein